MHDCLSWTLLLSLNFRPHSIVGFFLPRYISPELLGSETLLAYNPKGFLSFLIMAHNPRYFFYGILYILTLKIFRLLKFLKQSAPLLLSIYA
jgi:hypothetical protein